MPVDTTSVIAQRLTLRLKFTNRLRAGLSPPLEQTLSMVLKAKFTAGQPDSGREFKSPAIPRLQDRTLLV